MVDVWLFSTKIIRGGKNIGPLVSAMVTTIVLVLTHFCSIANVLLHVE